MPLFMPISSRIGPLTIRTGPTGIVVASSPCMLNSSVQAASSAASTTGQVLGLAAGHHGVDGDLLDGALDEVGRHDRRRSRRARATCPRASRSTRRLGRRHDGQAVGPAAVEHRLELVLEHGELDAPAGAASTRRSARRARRCGSGRRSASRSRVASRGDPAPRSSTPVKLSHCSRDQPSIRSDRAPSLDAQQGRHGLDVVVPGEREVARRGSTQSASVGKVGIVLGDDGQAWRASASSSSTGATRTQVGQSRLTTATSPSGSGGGLVVGHSLTLASGTCWQSNCQNTEISVTGLSTEVSTAWLASEVHGGLSIRSTCRSTASVVRRRAAVGPSSATAATPVACRSRRSGHDPDRVRSRHRAASLGLFDARPAIR